VEAAQVQPDAIILLALIQPFPVSYTRLSGSG